MTDKTDVERATDLWLKSRSNTAFTFVILKEAELSVIRETHDDKSEVYRSKLLECRAAITNYQSLCREAGISPYETMTDIRESVGMRA